MFGLEECSAFRCVIACHDMSGSGIEFHSGLLLDEQNGQRQMFSETLKREEKKLLTFQAVPPEAATVPVDDPTA
jgi:hypothetical protein